MSKQKRPRRARAARRQSFVAHYEFRQCRFGKMAFIIGRELYDSAQGTNGTTYERSFRVPAIIRWPGRVKPRSVQNGLFSGLDWLPTPVDCADNPNIAEQLLKGVKLGDRTYKNHLDGYDHRALLEAKDRLFDMSSSTSGVLSHWTVHSPDVS